MGGVTQRIEAVLESEVASNDKLIAELALLFRPLSGGFAPVTTPPSPPGARSVGS